MILAPGSTATAALRVGENDLASSYQIDATDEFPPVLATAKMIGLMEVAAARLMQPMVQPGELSVGVTVDIIHNAATAMGDTVTTEATFTGMDGKLYCFDVSARDSGGIVGSGTHKRAIVTTERLISGIAKRVNAAENA